MAAVGNTGMVTDDSITDTQVAACAPREINTITSSTATSSSSASIQINIANYMPPMDVRNHGLVNVPATHAQRQLTDDIGPAHRVNCVQNPPNVGYPATRNVIPALDMTQYSMALVDHGIQTVNDVRSAADDTFAAVGMPEGVFGIFRGYATAIACSAKRRWIGVDER